MVSEVAVSGHFTRPIGESSFRNYLDLLKFRSINAKKSRHLHDLIGTDEISGLSAEFLNPGSKLAALHRFRNVEAKAAGTFLRVMQTEIANDHFRPGSPGWCKSRSEPDSHKNGLRLDDAQDVARKAVERVRFVIIDIKHS